MTEWALPPKKSYVFGNLLHQLEQEHRDNILQFMHGGFWRNFLARYPEVNNQHKKMLRVHDAVYAAGATEEAGGGAVWEGAGHGTHRDGFFGGRFLCPVG